MSLLRRAVSAAVVGCIRRPEQVRRLDAEGEAIDDIDPGGIDRALKGTDVGAVDVGPMGKLLLRETFFP